MEIIFFLTFYKWIYMPKWMLFYICLALPCFAEQTLSIIKPDAVKSKHIGEILHHFEKNDLHVTALKMLKLSPEKARAFYQEHEGKPFFNDLIQFMSSGPIVAVVLSGDDAVTKNRNLMGPTDPAKAEKGTLRKEFATSITQNAVHGSDSKSSAVREIAFFFSSEEIVNP